MSEGFQPAEEGHEGYFEEKLPPLRRSGAVTAVAVVNFVIGGLQVLFGLIVLLLGPAALAFITGVASHVAKQPGMAAQDTEGVRQGVMAFGGMLAAILGFIGVCLIVFGLPMIFAGIGVLNRRPWGRILSLVLGGLAAFSALLNLMTFNVVGLVLHGGYAVLVFSILLNSDYAAEFGP